MAALNRLVYLRGAPTFLFFESEAEFTGPIVDLWAYHHKVRVNFWHLRTPTDNAHIESFNGSFRDECLNLNWFDSIGEARTTFGAWRRHFNESRPHMPLNGLTPAEFARKTRSDEEGPVQMAVGFWRPGWTTRPKHFRRCNHPL